MPTPSEHLAASLERLKALQRQGRVAVRARDLPRVHRERLSRNGFLHEVMKGWYIPARPGDAPGETTAWYSAFWPFAAQYLESRFEDAWCLSADQSLLLHVGDRTVPPQLLVRSPKGANKPTPLPHGTSVFDVRLELPAEQDRVTIEGVRMMTLAAALAYCTPDFFRARPVEARAALGMLTDASDLLRCLLDGGKSKIAGRLAAALRNVGRDNLADEVSDTFRAAGYTVFEADPFAEPSPLPLPVVRSRRTSDGCACCGPRCARSCSNTSPHHRSRDRNWRRTCSRSRTSTTPTPTTRYRSRATR